LECSLSQQCIYASINKPRYARLCVKRMRDASGGSQADAETNAMADTHIAYYSRMSGADEIVTFLTEDNFDNNCIKKRRKAKKHYRY
jgi:hypothetical protein